MERNALLDPVLELEAYNRVLDVIKKDNTAIKHTALCTGVIDSQKCHLSSAFSKHTGRPVLIVASSELKAREIYEDMRFFAGGGAKYYPVRDIIFYSADVKSADIIKQRFAVINSLLLGEKPTIVLSVEALFDRLTPKDIFKDFILEYEVGDSLSIEKLSKQLIFMGYERASLVEGVGQFAVRGGIIDIFTAVYDNAVRIELWGDEIDSIRLVDTYSQRSVEKINKLRIFPMRELVYREEDLADAVGNIKEEFDAVKSGYIKKGLTDEAQTLSETVSKVIEGLAENKTFRGVDRYIRYFYEQAATLLDYLDEDTLLFFDEPARLYEHAENVLGEFNESMKSRIEMGYMLPKQTDTVVSYYDILKHSERFTRVLYTTLTHGIRDFNISVSETFTVKSSGIMQKRIDLLEGDLKYYADQKYRTLILAGGKTRAERLCAELLEQGFSAKVLDELDGNTLEPGRIFLYKGSLNKGFEYPLIKLAVISGKEIFDGEKPKRKHHRKKKGSQIESFTDLQVGDYVVHDNHGIGVYRGIEKIAVDNVNKDYLKISYKDGGNLYVATDQLDMLQKFIGGDQAKPRLSKLGGGEWGKAKEKVRSAVKILAEDLIALYARREAAVGHVYSPDTVWQTEFEEQFAFEETDDQLSAIEDVKADMESSKVMDRLICGDVGYGKTEVAIRAAFKAVQDGKQVAYLVPTTILAQQHYNTFAQRMKDFPVNVDLLSRFKSAKEQKMTVEKLKKGLVDIVIGTHRLLSQDIRFKDLGLVIVDEEQRFGVSHKEKLKRLTENVDVLTLTATPIPRTLHMSLTGIRNMSILDEPPEERQPIQTYVMEYNAESVKDAIHREISRGGQVYYLHNRVRNISEVAARVQSLVPDAVVSYAHGQMSEHELERIMLDFIEGEIDVLVCTTIIEAGLDIPNVNTIIIQDSDFMGVSQLYQLRGRVGRSNRSSFAYLMYKKDKVLTETSEKRLQTIREFTEFGSGFKIAMRDLEIRGAGNILGAEQHGHMDAVGYDMYCKLLLESVNELKGVENPEKFETLIDISANAFIPPYYIEDELQKLEVYKKISTIQTEQDYFDIQEEIEDRYGNLPASAQNLLNIAYLKACAHSVGVISVKQKDRSIIISFKPDANVDPNRITALVTKNRARLSFKVASNPFITYKLSEDEGAAAVVSVREMLKVLM